MKQKFNQIQENREESFEEGMRTGQKTKPRPNRLLEVQGRGTGRG
jgi:hypothetical protein